jgi:hypothetical protein
MNLTPEQGIPGSKDTSKVIFTPYFPNPIKFDRAEGIIANPKAFFTPLSVKYTSRPCLCASNISLKWSSGNTQGSIASHLGSVGFEVGTGIGGVGTVGKGEGNGVG